MRPEVRSALLVLIAIATGRIGWSGHVLLIPVSLAFPILWSIANTRIVAGLVSAGYFLAASRSLPEGVATYFQSDLWQGLLLWLLASSSFICVHASLWSNDATARPLRYLAAMTLTAVPPFGLLGWAHPLTAAGVLFPTWGWEGVVVSTGCLIGLTSPIRSIVALSVLGFWLSSAATWSDAVQPDGWMGFNLKMGVELGRSSSMRYQTHLVGIVTKAQTHGNRVLVLPESALGAWTPTVDRLWTRALADRQITVVAGAYVITSDGYDNVILAMSAKGGRILYRQRVPVPGSMWQPWRSWGNDASGAREDFFANPSVKLGDTRLAPLICYELLLTWPVLHSMLQEPEVIVAVGNGWWTAGTTIVDIQHANAEAWARLFGKQLVFSFNT